MNNVDLFTEVPVETVPPLSLINVERRFKQTDGYLTVLDGANLTITDGEMVALVAPSGAGKSTLLQIAGLLEQPDSGEVVINGRPCAAMNDENRTLLRRLEIGFVTNFTIYFQNLMRLKILFYPNSYGAWHLTQHASEPCK